MFKIQNDFKMKRLMMMLLMFGIVFASLAQQGGRGKREPNKEERIERAKTELSLSDEQVTQWKEIHEKYESEMKEARENREELRNKIEQELKAILTEEQQAKFEEMKKKRPKRRQRD